MTPCGVSRIDPIHMLSSSANVRTAGHLRSPESTHVNFSARSPTRAGAPQQSQSCDTPLQGTYHAQGPDITASPAQPMPRESRVPNW